MLANWTLKKIDSLIVGGTETEEKILYPLNLEKEFEVQKQLIVDNFPHICVYFST